MLSVFESATYSVPSSVAKTPLGSEKVWVSPLYSKLLPITAAPEKSLFIITTLEFAVSAIYTFPSESVQRSEGDDRLPIPKSAVL